MKGSVLLLFLSLLVCCKAEAAELVSDAVVKPDSTKKDTSKAVSPDSWKPTGNTGFNVSEVSFTNWSQGGENSLTWSVFFNLALDKDFSKIKLKNQLKTNYGMTKAGEASYKINEKSC